MRWQAGRRWWWCMAELLLLQRRLGSGDAHKWRTVLRFTPAQMPLAEQLVRLAIQIDPLIQWRLTTAAGALLAEQ